MSGAPHKVLALNAREHAPLLAERTRALPVEIRHAEYHLPWSEVTARRAGVVRGSEVIDAPLRELLHEAEVAFAFTLPLGSADLAPRLRWVETPAAGYDQLNGTGVLERDVAVTTVGSVFGPIVAEHVFATLLALWRRLGEFRDAQRDRLWTPREVRELRGATMAIVGFGNIGKAVAQLARAFGMRVVAVRRRPQENAAEADRLLPPERLHEAFAEADVVVLAVTGSAETRGLIGSAELTALRPDACLINVARGFVVDEPALAEALAAGRIAGAALDVFGEEPLPPESRFWELPNVVVTPHVAVNVRDKFRRPIEHFADNLARFVNGEPLLDRVVR